MSNHLPGPNPDRTPPKRMPQCISITIVCICMYLVLVYAIYIIFKTGIPQRFHNCKSWHAYKYPEYAATLTLHYPQLSALFTNRSNHFELADEISYIYIIYIYIAELTNICWYTAWLSQRAKPAEPMNIGHSDSTTSIQTLSFIQVKMYDTFTSTANIYNIYIQLRR